MDPLITSPVPPSYISHFDRTNDFSGGEGGGGRGSGWAEVFQKMLTASPLLHSCSFLLALIVSLSKMEHMIILNMS